MDIILALPLQIRLGLQHRSLMFRKIVSNMASEKVSEVNLKGLRIILRKPQVEITEQNHRILQFLDLLKDIDVYTDDIIKAAERLSKYIRDEKLRKEDFDKYCSLYPNMVYRNLNDLILQ